MYITQWIKKLHVKDNPITFSDANIGESARF